MLLPVHLYLLLIIKLGQLNYFQYLAERRQAVCEAVENIILTYFPAEVIERKQQQEEDISAMTRFDIIIYVDRVNWFTQLGLNLYDSINKRLNL